MQVSVHRNKLTFSILDPHAPAGYVEASVYYFEDEPTTPYVNWPAYGDISLLRASQFLNCLLAALNWAKDHPNVADLAKIKPEGETW